MANSLRAKIKKLHHDGKISAEECVELLEKLDGHDGKLTFNAFYEGYRKGWGEAVFSVLRPVEVNADDK